MKPLIHPLTVVKIIFAVLGAALMIPAFLIGKNAYLLSTTGIVTQGEIVELIYSQEDGYTPLVSFETSLGETVVFKSSLSQGPGDYAVGERLNVVYLEKDPRIAEIRSFTALWLLPLVAGGAGMVFASIGMGIIIYQKRRRAMIEWLKRSGQPLQTIYSGVEQNTRLKVNGRSPYRIASTWQGGGKEHVFYSDDLWVNPSAQMKSSQTIIVLVDPANFKRYYMEVTFLKSL